MIDTPAFVRRRRFTVVPAEGELLQRILDAEHHASRASGLNRRAYAQFETAQMKTLWGREHRRRFALVGDGDALASATRYSLSGVLAGRAIRLCAIGDVLVNAGSDARHLADQLIEGLVAAAAGDGHDLVLLVSRGAAQPEHDGFAPLPMSEVTLGIAQSRRGAPMTLIRGGEPRDWAAIVAMGRRRASPFRFHLDRDIDFLQHVIARQRLLAGLGRKGARELQFFIAEEGITAAAYVVISVVGETWTLEECGDGDATGARVGAILQALIARQPAERRPEIRGWLPPGFLPPQVTILSTQPATERIAVHLLNSAPETLALRANDVLYWRSDCL